jgi:L-histidine Nalpha-methyltransferase
MKHIRSGTGVRNGTGREILLCLGQNREYRVSSVERMLQIQVHESQFPGVVRGELANSLRRRELNHKFLYDSAGQTRKWLALHEAYSPSRTDPGCKGAYDAAFEAAATAIGPGRVHVIGLGCGGGQKDSRLLELLAARDATAAYTAIDVSHSMVLTACETAAAHARINPGIVCDFASVRNFGDLLDPALHCAPSDAGTHAPQRPASRLITFFGMIPNFEPGAIMPALAGALGSPEDLLLFSANLAPGASYGEGVRQVLPLYDNRLTRDWLLGFLDEIGIGANDGDLAFTIEDGTVSELKRITARFHFNRTLQIAIDSDRVEFSRGDRLRVFFSYRHSCGTVEKLLRDHGLIVSQSWLAPSREEGIFMARRARA